MWLRFIKFVCEKEGTRTPGRRRARPLGSANAIEKNINVFIFYRFLFSDPIFDETVSVEFGHDNDCALIILFADDWLI